MDDIEIELDYNPWPTDNEELGHALTQPDCDSTSHGAQHVVVQQDSNSPASFKNTKKRGLTDSDSARLVNILSNRNGRAVPSVSVLP